MCVVSTIGDGWSRRPPQPAQPWIQPNTTTFIPFNAATKEDIAALRREIEALKKLLLAAKRYDEETGQPDCETEDKVALIKKLAEVCGVDLEDVFGE